ncbi:hypothetical protein OIV83_006269 [Microbotryomycetes sp. JL201]|nr:hypothetical protein OIV83_006269 [Microbotryomycetes sp. JL201]
MSDPRLNLPPPPPDTNPYAYWNTILRFSLYAPPPPGFKWLEPILILMVCIVELLHVSNEWNITINEGSQRDADVLRIVPFTVVLMYLWIMSWAALQSFILASGDHNATLRFLTPKLANTLFIGALDVVSAVLSHRAWFAYRRLEDYLAMQAATWTSEQQPITNFQQAARVWADYVAQSLSTIDVVRALIIFFAVFPIFTFLVNLGAFGLLMAVRRQIRLTYGGFNRDLLKRDEVDITSFPSRYKVSANGLSQTGISAEAPHSITIAITAASPVLGQGPLDAGDAGGTSSVVNSDAEASATQSHRSYASHQGGRSTGSTSNSQPSRKQDGLPSRARTACSMTAMSIGFAALCLWVAIALENIGTSTWFAREASVLLATYVFAIVASITVTLRLHQLYVNMRLGANRRPSVATSLSLSGEMTEKP